MPAPLNKIINLTGAGRRGGPVVTSDEKISLYAGNSVSRLRSGNVSEFLTDNQQETLCDSIPHRGSSETIRETPGDMLG